MPYLRSLGSRVRSLVSAPARVFLLKAELMSEESVPVVLQMGRRRWPRHGLGRRGWPAESRGSWSSHGRRWPRHGPAPSGWASSFGGRSLLPFGLGRRGGLGTFRPLLVAPARLLKRCGPTLGTCLFGLWRTALGQRRHLGPKALSPF